MRSILASLLAFLLLCPPSLALVSIDDGKNQIFVNSSVSYAWDSNVFSNSNNNGDSIYSASLGLDYRRHAGMIGINASVNVDASSFITNTSENFLNPRFQAEFTKQTGRTTGSITMGAGRQSQADSAANLRAESWAYNAGLNLKYPVIERYTLAANLGYALTDYQDNSFLVDLSTYSMGLDIFYIYNSERDLIGGYRLRYSETSANSGYYDNSFTAGISGKIFPKVAGTVRFGYQFREPTRKSDGAYSGITASGQMTWTINKKMNATILLSKDFSTTSTNTSVDATTASMDFQYGINSKTSVYLGLGYGINEFLGEIGGNRQDTYFTWSTGVNYTLSSYLKLALSYTYFHNWSTADFSEYERNSASLTASSTF